MNRLSYSLILLILFTAGVWADTPAPSTNSTTITTVPDDSAAASSGAQLLALFRSAGRTGLVQLAVSLFGGASIAGCLLKLRRKNVVPSGLSDRARELWAKGDFAALEALKDQEPSTLARAISFIAKHRHQSMSDVSAAVGDRVSTEIAAFNQLAYPLGVIATLQPLLGLLGMIMGMIQAFSMVALAGVLGNAAQLAGGISEALSTTALGIAFAIPFLAAYHYFRSRTNGYGVMISGEINDLLSDWLMRAHEN